jgi:hypothetical protein
MKWIAILAILAGCSWGLGEDLSFDDEVRRRNNELNHSDIRSVERLVSDAVFNLAEPADISEETREEGVGRWRMWQKKVTKKLWGIQERCIDEGERAIIRLKIDNYPPAEEVDVESNDAAQNYNRLAARSHAEETKRRVVAEEVPGKIAAGVAKVGGAVVKGLWDLLPWWLHTIIIGLVLSLAWSAFQSIRLKLKLKMREAHASQKEAEVAELEKNLGHLKQRKAEIWAALREYNQWVEDAVPQNIRQKLVKFPNMRREHEEVNRERKSDMAKWAKNILGEGMLTDEEQAQLNEHLHNLSEETREKTSIGLGES